MKLVNPEDLSVGIINQQMLEPRPLPQGITDFEEWSDRIIAGAMIPMDKDADEYKFKRSLKYALAGHIMHLGPTESHKADAFFIHCLRKQASQNVAYEVARKIEGEKEKEKAASEVSI